MSTKDVKEICRLCSQHMDYFSNNYWICLNNECAEQGKVLKIFHPSVNHTIINKQNPPPCPKCKATTVYSTGSMWACHTCKERFPYKEGGKQSDIKCRLDMVPLANLKVGEVCAEGNLKYDKDNPMLNTTGPISPNWHKITAREHVIHAKYHIEKLLSGDTDEDHLAHAACRMMFALEMELMG